MIRWCLVAAAWLAAPLPVLNAQQPAAQVPPLFTSAAELVVMNVVVRDHEGIPVTGLSRDSFTVLEDDHARDIDLFASHDEPVTIGLVIDGSGSMLANRSRLAYAIGQFASANRPDDEVFALVVADRVTPVLPAERPFTNDPEVLRTAVFQALRSRGRTKIWDGVLEGLRYLERGSHTRRALVVISDGQDNASQTRFSDVMSRVRSQSAAVYTMGLISPTELVRRPGSLTNLARASGGEAFFPETHQSAVTALGVIARQIHSAYTIGFEPSTKDTAGRYHRLEVKVKAASGRRLDVRTRSSYAMGESAEAAR